MSSDGELHLGQVKPKGTHPLTMRDEPPGE